MFVDGRHCQIPGQRKRRGVFPRSARDPLFAVIAQAQPLAQDEYIHAYDTASGGADGGLGDA